MLQGTDRLVLEEPGTPVGRRHHIRGAVFLCLLLVGFCVVVTRLVYLQVFKHEEYRWRASRQQTKFSIVYARRGTFYDASMRPLVLSEAVQSVFVSPVEVEDLEGTATALAGMLGLDRAKLAEELEQRADLDFMWVKRRVTQEEAEKTAQAKLTGVHFKTEYRRRYPQGNLASQTLGWTDIDNRGLEGLEGLFDKELRGVDGYQRTECDVGRHAVVTDKAEYVPVRHGTNIVLTINLEIQRIVEEEADAVDEKFGPESLTIIVMDPHRGTILAVCNRPTFDPARPADVPAEARQNRAVIACYEPGSVFKPFVMSRLFDLGKGTPSEKIFCENGLFRVPGIKRTLRDHDAYGWLTLSEVIEKSSNIGMAKVGLALGKDDLYKAVRGFGFGQRTGVEMMGELAGRLTPEARWSGYTVTSVPMGQEITVTPMQLINAFNVFANGGWLLKPSVVEAELDSEGKIVKQLCAPERIKRVISGRTAATMVDIMHKVVLQGTGKAAQGGEYSKAGKTGTAQKASETGGYSHTKFVASFLCVAPVEDPRITVLVLVNEPRKGPSYYAASVAAPSAANIAERVLKYMKVPPSVSEDRRRTL